MTRRDMADFGRRRIEEPTLRGHVRDRDQRGARPDRAFEWPGVDLTEGVARPRRSKAVICKRQKRFFI